MREAQVPLQGPPLWRQPRGRGGGRRPRRGRGPAPPRLSPTEGAVDRRRPARAPLPPGSSGGRSTSPSSSPGLWPRDCWPNHCPVANNVCVVLAERWVTARLGVPLCDRGLRIGHCCGNGGVAPRPATSTTAEPFWCHLPRPPGSEVILASFLICLWHGIASLHRGADLVGPWRQPCRRAGS